MSEKANRWLKIHAPIAISLIALMATGGVAFGATQSTATNNTGAIGALAEDLDKLEDRIISRLNHQDTRMDRMLSLLIEEKEDAKSR